MGPAYPMNWAVARSVISLGGTGCVAPSDGWFRKASQPPGNGARRACVVGRVQSMSSSGRITVSATGLCLIGHNLVGIALEKSLIREDRLDPDRLKTPAIRRAISRGGCQQCAHVLGLEIRAPQRDRRAVRARLAAQAHADPAPAPWRLVGSPSAQRPRRHRCRHASNTGGAPARTLEPRQR